MYRFSIPAFALTLAIGLMAGSTLTAWTSHTPPAIRLVDDGRADVPVVRIDGIRNGTLVGMVSGQARVVAGGKPVLLDGSGGFAIRDSAILTNTITITVPPGMHFMASKRGKKYYPVNASEAQRIVPENRIYFPDAASAQKAGFAR